MSRHIKKGDSVIVTAGKRRGSQGKVMRVFPDTNKVLVEGINLCKKHVRPSQANQRGGIVEKEMPIHISNVSPVVNGKATRVRFETKEDGSKVRLAAINGEQIGA